ncbi:MAG: hypothetical protein QW052_06135 [Candidatus Nitrosocaldaceae archaeon]
MVEQDEILEAYKKINESYSRWVKKKLEGGLIKGYELEKVFYDEYGVYSNVQRLVSEMDRRDNEEEERREEKRREGMMHR